MDKENIDGIYPQTNYTTQQFYTKEEYEKLQAELKKYEDMAKKGLEEFKDVGGCWGCGLQLQLNQDIEDIKQLKAENERLKQEWRLDCLKCEYKNTKADVDKYKQALQKIREIANTIYNTNCNYVAESHKIITKINEVMGAE